MKDHFRKVAIWLQRSKFKHTGRKRRGKPGLYAACTYIQHIYNNTLESTNKNYYAGCFSWKSFNDSCVRTNRQTYIWYVRATRFN